MINLNNFNNIYANLAQSAYEGDDTPMSLPKRTPEDNKLVYSDDFILNGKIKAKGGQNLPNNGVLYLQPNTNSRFTN